MSIDSYNTTWIYPLTLLEIIQKTIKCDHTHIQIKQIIVNSTMIQTDSIP